MLVQGNKNILIFSNVKDEIWGKIMVISWKSIKKYNDIKFERGLDNAKGVAKITINRPEVRNSFRPKTVFEGTNSR